jgi:predicted nucleotidyltransferase
MAISAAKSAEKPAASPSTPRFMPPAIPWLEPKTLAPFSDLGPGLDPQRCSLALERLCAEADVQAVLVFGSRARGEARADSDLDLAVILRQPQLTPAEKQLCWRRLRQAIGPLDVGVDLIVAGAADAARLSGSRWHVFGDVAREGKVLHVAG